MQLLGRCGLRADEVPYPSDDDLRWSDDGEVWLFEIRGKDPKGGSPKTRDAWMPEDVVDDIHKYSRGRELDANDSWVSASKSSVRRWVKEAAEREDAPRWRSVSSHDLRRSWATYTLWSDRLMSGR